MTRLRPLLALVLLLLAGGAFAQSEAELREKLRLRLEGYRTELAQIEQGLLKRDLSDTELTALRDRVLPIAEGTRGLVAAIRPFTDSARARLDQLGPPPAEGAPPESPDIAKDRAARQKELSDVTEFQKVTGALLLEAEQLGAMIADRRRALFTQSLFARSFSLVSPDLWTQVVSGVPRDFDALRRLASDWTMRALERTWDGRILILLTALIIGVGLVALKRTFAARLTRRDPDKADPSRLRVAATAGWRVLFNTVPIAVACLIVYAALDAIYLLPIRVGPVAVAILGGIAFIVFARALGDALLAPGLPQWRVLTLDDTSAQRFMRLVWTGSALIATGKIVDALLQAILTPLATAVMARGLFAVGFALLLIGTLRQHSVSTGEQDDECLGPYVPVESRFAAPLRLMGWLAAAVIIAAALAGYIAFASFVVDQIVWISVILGVLALASMFVDEALSVSVGGQTRVSAALQAGLGLRKRSLEQVAVLGSGLARVILFAMALLVALAPWGVQSADWLSSIRAAFFGFQVGSVTISLSTVLTAALLFAIVVAITRAVQRWLDKKFLPTTEMDAGLRNSISTVFGYAGIIIAGALAFSEIGLSLDNIAIVAGALSVGIGFGLQAIVSNFVSGLILLWERPIRVGDQIVVGDAEGYVRRINVRSTEIETFDRSTLIVPNSNLVTGVVRNRVRGDRTGRIIIPVSLPRSVDPTAARSALLEVVRAHKDVLAKPEPRIFFKKIGDANLDFDVICFVGDVEWTARVSSDLHFAIYERILENGLTPPVPVAHHELHGLDRIEAAVDRIAQAVGRRADPSPASPETSR